MEDETYELFKIAGFKDDAMYKPLGYKEEPFNWVLELNIAPWMIFILIK